MEGGEIENRKGKQKMRKVWLFIIALMVVLAILSLPLVPQTRITVVTYLDTITNVSIETPRIPLIVVLIPSPSIATGAYTINVNASQYGMLVFNATLQNVPSGQYTFIWVSNGQPKAGTYHVAIQLMRVNVQVDSYVLDVTFG